MFQVQEPLPLHHAVEPGETLLAAGLSREALPFLGLALESDSKNARHWSNLAVAYRHDGQLGPALSHIKWAIDLDPSIFAWYINRGKILEDLGRFDEALADYKKALELDPKSENARRAYAFAQLRQGNFEEAWPYWMECHPCAWAQGVPPYNGEELKGKRILVTRNGGYGDTFWLLRYLKVLYLRGAHVTFCGWRNQRQLLQGHPWVDRWIDADDAVEESEFDFQIPLMMLMPIIGVVPYPMREPYIQAKPAAINERIGVCWSAAEVGQTRKFRSIPVEQLEFLGKAATDRLFISLQPGECPNWMRPLGKAEDGFCDTARIIAGLDLVITIDSAIAHLAGAMGVPTLCMLPLNSDWKWWLNRDDSPWYLSSFRVFRNTDPIDMSPVVRQVAEVLGSRFVKA